jgi:MFS transporter, DHA2 family, multidrug resistance protein
MADALPSGLGSEQAAAAEDTLGGALEVVEGLGGVRGTTLLENSEEAFTQGMQVAAVAAAAVALGTALLAALFLRRTGTGSPPERELEAEPNVAMEAAWS